jgi:hypothetical protein
MARLEMTTDADLAKRAEAYPCALHATGRDGRPHAVEVLAPPGFSATGLNAATVVDKFIRVTDGHLAHDARERIIEAVMGLDTASSPRALMQSVLAT